MIYFCYKHICVTSEMNVMVIVKRNSHFFSVISVGILFFNFSIFQFLCLYSLELECIEYQTFNFTILMKGIKSIYFSLDRDDFWS